MNWLTEHFNPQTTPLDSTAKRLLIVDGHESHCTINFIEFCDLYNIILLILPPHTTHYLQPLDVTCFGPLQRWYSAEVEAHGRFNGTYVENLIFYASIKELGPQLLIQRISTQGIKQQVLFRTTRSAFTIK
jgi:hypothetical protein